MSVVLVQLENKIYIMETHIEFRTKINELSRLEERYNKVQEYIHFLNLDESYIRITMECEGISRCNIPLPRTIASDVKKLVFDEYCKEKKDIENKMAIFLKKVGLY